MEEKKTRLSDIGKEFGFTPKKTLEAVKAMGKQVNNAEIIVSEEKQEEYRKLLGKYAADNSKTQKEIDDLSLVKMVGMHYDVHKNKYTLVTVELNTAQLKELGANKVASNVNIHRLQMEVAKELVGVGLDSQHPLQRKRDKYLEELSKAKGEKK